MIKIQTTKEESSLQYIFYQPLDRALNRARNTRDCTEYPDLMYLRSGVGRVIEGSQSGREWVQLFRAIVYASLSVANFFAALRSNRRLRLLREIDLDIRQQAVQLIRENGDPLAKHPELENFEIYASDGHSHGASAHEDKRYGKKRAVNHIFSLNLRTHTMAHLALTQPAEGKKKEHEIKTLKRIGGDVLRFGVPKGVKVIHAYDPAVVDYNQWYKWKQGHGVYIISLEKSNSALLTIGIRSWDKDDPRNAGVVADELIGSPNGTSLRRVRYQDPVTGNVYAFLTTEMTLPPGLIAFIYKLRWDLEKVFDEVKNKLEQQQAWGKNETAKIQQAIFIAMSHNLMLMLEKKLEVEEGITDEKVRRKQAQRLAADSLKARQAKRVPNSLVENLHRATQRSLQFIRWLRTGLAQNTSWDQAVDEVRPLMLNYLS
jgi:hypothetical protein